MQTIRYKEDDNGGVIDNGGDEIAGSAKRKCTEEKSWLEADLFNCTSDNFTRLTQQVCVACNCNSDKKIAPHRDEADNF